MTDENDDLGNERIESIIGTLGQPFNSRRDFLKKGAAVSAAGLGLSAGAGNVAAHDDETTTASASGNESYVKVLNYALTLERLEATFYRQGLSQFSQSQIESSDIGQQFGDKVRFRIYEGLVQIKEHEEAHVEALVQTISNLGGDPVGENDVEFQFDFGTPEEFIRTAQTLETTGVSAYTGAIDMLSGSAELLTAAATIATVEARHSAVLNALTAQSPFPSSFDEPKEPDEILQLIQPFIVS